MRSTSESAKLSDSVPQMPHALRVMLALVSGADEHRPMIVPDAGGEFGSKVTYR